MKNNIFGIEELSSFRKQERMEFDTNKMLKNILEKIY